MKQLVALLVLGMAHPCWAGGTELELALGNVVTLIQESDRSIIEYCPDNTCERFFASGATSLPDLHDFAFAYLFAISNYVYLKPF